MEVDFKGGSESLIKKSAIQIETNEQIFDRVQEGQIVTINCSDLWEGNTGHYALSLYCKGPSIKDIGSAQENKSSQLLQPKINLATLKNIDNAGLISYTSPSATMNSCVVILAALASNPDLSPNAAKSLKDKATQYAALLKIELEKDPNGVASSAQVADKLMADVVAILQADEHEAVVNAGTACIKALQ